MIRCVLVKDGVKFDRIAPAGFRILAVIQNATYIFDRDLTISCGTDSHPPTDPHSLGEAYDLSVLGMTDEVIIALVKHLQAQLGPLFTVLFETPSQPSALLAPMAFINAQASARHIHTQRRKGTLYPPTT